ncbi:hypothetical protein EUX53_11205 [Pseudomonas orientalis]|nr:hypothetical protein EUX53_11205 [Pseudomonas orientalis]
MRFSRASSLLHKAAAPTRNHDAQRVALDLDLLLISGAPLNHAGRREGTPSPGEVPSGGARAFCLLLRFSKVSRCKSGTLSGRDLNNGYVLGLIQDTGQP